MSQITQTLKEYEQILTECESRWDMLQTLIEIGKELPEFDAKLKIPQNKAPNCISEVYIYVTIIEDRLNLHITADAHIVKGFAKIMLDTFQQSSIQEFMEQGESHILQFIKKTQIDSSFLSSRANAFGNMFVFLKEKIKQLSK